MDSLYREISERMTAEIRPIIERPSSSVIELVEHRALVFERLLPFKIAGDAHRHDSKFLTGEQNALVEAQRKALRSALSEKIDRVRFEVLDLLLSFEAWRRLRRDQGLSVRDARAAMLLGAEALTSR